MKSKEFEFNDIKESKKSHFKIDTNVTRKISNNEDEKTEFSKTLNSFDKTLNSKKTDHTNVNETTVNLKENDYDDENINLIKNEIFDKISSRISSIQYSIKLIENESNTFKNNNLNIRNLLDSLI